MAERHRLVAITGDAIVRTQEEWEREAERRRAEAPDPSCPPGMKLMPEEERLKTLGLLQVRRHRSKLPHSNSNQLGCELQLGL